MSMGQLDQNLRRFYAEARTVSGQYYSKSTLLGFRHSIERYLNASPYNRNLRIVQDPKFSRSNQMLDAQLKMLKRIGKENVQHKPPIEPEDLQKLKSSNVFSFDSPLSLLRCVWFNVVLYFCRRGREGQRSLTSTSFKFETDGNGRNYVKMAHDEASKNHPGGLNDTASHEKEARMYETNDDYDGYKAVQLYMSKLNPNSTAFFQYPKRNFNLSDEIWYEARPIGVNSLDNIMKSISKDAGLSKSYTNHSVRATAITIWSNAGVENRHIMAISGHRNEQSLVHYNSRPSTSQLLNCSSVLSDALNGTTSIVPRRHEQADPVQLSHHHTQMLPSFPVFSNCTIANLNVFQNN